MKLYDTLEAAEAEQKALNEGTASRRYVVVEILGKWAVVRTDEDGRPLTVL